MSIIRGTTSKPRDQPLVSHHCRPRREPSRCTSLRVARMNIRPLISAVVIIGVLLLWRCAEVGIYRRRRSRSLHSGLKENITMATKNRVKTEEVSDALGGDLAVA